MTKPEEVNLGKLIHEVNGLRQNFKDFGILNEEKEKQLIEYNKKLDRVLTLILGDEAQPKTGLLYRIEQIEEFIKYLEKTRNKLTGSVATAIFILSVVGGIIGIIFKLIDYFKK